MNKSSIIILIILLALTTVVFWLIIPFYGQINSSKMELKAKQKTLAETQATVNVIQDLAKKYEAMKDELDEINSVLPDKEDLAGLIVSLEAMSSESGIFLKSINFQPKPFQPATMEEVSETGGYNALQIQLAALGSYSGFKNFIKTIEKNLRLMDVKTIKFKSGEKEEFDINLDLETYYK